MKGSKSAFHSMKGQAGSCALLKLPGENSGDGIIRFLLKMVNSKEDFDQKFFEHHKHMHTHIHINSYVYKHTYVHLQIHTHKHTYVHTYT